MNPTPQLAPAMPDAPLQLVFDPHVGWAIALIVLALVVLFGLSLFMLAGETKAR